MGDQVVTIEYAQGRTVVENGGDMAAEMDDETVGNILFSNRDFACLNVLSHGLQILPELFRVRPGNCPALPPQGVDDEVRAIGAEPGLRTVEGPVVQFP